MAVLVNGDGFKPVTAQMDADFYAGIWGDGLSVINVGSNMAASIESATVVRVADGEAVIQGRRIHIDAGSYDEFSIPIGEQGATKYFVIGYELYRNAENKELCRTFVQEVASASATVPAGGVLRDGATSIKAPLYRVTKNGVNIGSITALFEAPKVMSRIFPVGAVYISTTATNPSVYFGGTWRQIEGRFLLGQSSSYAAGSTGGSATKTLSTDNLPPHAHSGPSHTHSIAAHKHTGTTGSAGAHSHTLHRWLAGGTGTARYAAQGDSSTPTYSTNSAGAHTHSFTTNAGGGGNTGAAGTGSTGSVGRGTAFSIMPPYLTVYMWERTA